MNNPFLNHYKKIAMVFVILFFPSCGYLIKPNIQEGIVNLEKGSYKIDPLHTSVLFKVNHMGMSTFVGRFNRVEASLEFDPKNMVAANLSASLDVASVDVNNKDLEETLRSDSWFATEKFPQAFFKTTSVEVIDEKRAKFNGTLTLHGISAPIVWDVTFNGGGDNLLTGFYTLGFSASTSIKRSQFGVDYLIPAISDEVVVDVFAEFQKNKK